MKQRAIIEDENRDKFLKEYIRMVGDISSEAASKLWWASDMASKNRFTSKLMPLCQEFLEVKNAMTSQNRQKVLVANPSWVISPAIKGLAKNLNVEVAERGARYNKYMEVSARYLRRFAGIFYHILRSYSRALYARWVLGRKIENNLSQNSYYLIKTFIYNHSFKENSYQDAFFGRLPEFIKVRKNLLVFACILGSYRRNIQKIKNCQEYFIVPLEFFLSFGDIMAAVKEWFLGLPKIKKDVLFFDCNIRSLVNNELLRTAGGVQFYQFLHYWAAKKLAQKVKIESFLLTYENNPWEKMCTLAMREVSPGTKIIWYQNTVIPQAAASMFMSKTEEEKAPLPDLVLTLGGVTKHIMEKYGDYGKLKLEPSCGLKFEYLYRAEIYPRKREGNILITLEGIFESYKVLNYVLRDLRNKPEHKLKVRTHPILPFEAFKHKLGYDFKEIGNFTISKNSSLKDDIQWADLVVYWGSIAALEALGMGKPVIHFDLGSALSFDPLFECQSLHWTANRSANLEEIIEQIYSLSNEEFIRQQKEARSYLQGYFYPVEEKSLIKFLN